LVRISQQSRLTSPSSGTSSMGMDALSTMLLPPCVIPARGKRPADSRPPASVHKPCSDLRRGSDTTCLQVDADTPALSPADENFTVFGLWNIQCLPSRALTHSLLISPTLPCACLRSPVFPCSPTHSLSTAFPHFADFSRCECSAPLPILGHPVCPLVPTLANAP